MWFKQTSCINFIYSVSVLLLDFSLSFLKEYYRYFSALNNQRIKIKSKKGSYLFPLLLTPPPPLPSLPPHPPPLSSSSPHHHLHPPYLPPPHSCSVGRPGPLGFSCNTQKVLQGWLHMLAHISLGCHCHSPLFPMPHCGSTCCAGCLLRHSWHCCVWL